MSGDESDPSSSVRPWRWAEGAGHVRSYEPETGFTSSSATRVCASTIGRFDAGIPRDQVVGFDGAALNFAI